MFDYTFRWHQALRSLPQMLEGALVTMEIALLSMAIGIAIAVALTLFRLSGLRALAAIATVWVETRATHRRCSRSTWCISAWAASGCTCRPICRC